MFQRIASYVGAAILVIAGAFAAIKGYVPVPGTAASAAPSSSAIALSAHAKIILTYNNQQAYWVGGVTQWSVPAKGVTVNKITPAQAQDEANALDATVPTEAPLSVPYALLASESVLDPSCQNGNFLGSNPTKSPWGYDDGVAQLKLKYITIRGKSGPAAFSTAADAQAFAFDVRDAIPYFWGSFNSHLATADKLISGNTNSAIDPRLMNRWVLGALCFKQGDTGCATIFAGGTWPAELNNFVSLEGYFAKQLGQKSVFAQ